MRAQVIYLSDLELIGDTGGEVGAGVSASSSSSSPHSSSLSGVMLLPSHTECIETWRRKKIHCATENLLTLITKHRFLELYFIHFLFFYMSYLSKFVVHVAHLPLCVDLKQQLLMADQRAC